MQLSYFTHTEKKSSLAGRAFFTGTFPATHAASAAVVGIQWDRFHTPPAPDPGHHTFQILLTISLTLVTK